jgi:hypothetical protein
MHPVVIGLVTMKSPTVQLAINQVKILLLRQGSPVKQILLCLLAG